MFSYKFCVLVLFFGISSYLVVVVDAKPSDTSCLNMYEEQKEALIQCKFELNQSITGMAIYEEKLKIETNETEAMNLQNKITLLEQDLEQSKSSCKGQSEKQNVQKPELVTELGSIQREKQELETLESYVESRRRLRFEDKVTNAKKNLEHFKFYLQQAQQRFEKIKNETNQNEQILQLVTEITIKQNLEWYEKDLESIVSRVTWDFLHLRNNVTNLLQGFQQFKSNLQELKNTITNYETQLKKETEIQKHQKEFVTQVSTFEPDLNQKIEKYVDSLLSVVLV